MIPIIDTGHGYNTPGKRSDGFNDKDGYVILKENSVNEAIGNKLSLLFYNNCQEAYFISNEWRDISLQERVDREQKIYKKLKEPSVFISIHADAFDVKNAAEGGRFFYHSDAGRVIAEDLTDYMRNYGYKIKLRPPMQKNFKVLKDTASPAVLFELGFMTTKSDLDLLMSDDFRNHTANLLFNGISQL